MSSTKLPPIKQSLFDSDPQENPFVVPSDEEILNIYENKQKLKSKVKPFIFKELPTSDTIAGKAKPSKKQQSKDRSERLRRRNNLKPQK